jgi:7-carboxy-7-deazaguanine synthase
MTYLVNDIFLTLQGEGYWTGRAAVFCRFSRCNLWTGREEDRATAVCQFCDTDFTRADKYGLKDLADTILNAWPKGAPNPMVVFTGGEPLLQLDEPLLVSVQARGFYVAVETNGTVVPKDRRNIDWLCVSPKADTDLAVTDGDELKLVYPQPLAPPERFQGWAFDHFWLSPMDGPNLARNTDLAVGYVKRHPQWRLNIQTHKVIGVK